LNKKNYNDGFEIEKRALTKAKRVIFSSEWAKQSVKEYYDIPEDKIDAFPFGANLLRIPEEKELKFIKSGEINLLFIGLDWERKGGTIALDTHRILKKNGIKSKLFIVGCSPKLAELDESVIIYPYLNKNDNRDFEKLFNIFRNSDFLILPTRAECSAIVLCEASAFGVPSITTDTGGLASHVENGVNGYRLSLEAKAEEYAEKILNIYEDTGTYINMRHTSRQKFENELNWDSWMKNFEMTIKKALE
jgi:glycosyltransferase involved in cell wall biosynthesis